MSFGNNLGAQVINTFGPLIVGGLGFDKYTTTLLNMHFGALQYLIILVVAYIAIKFRFKSISLGFIILPIIAGLVVLFVIPRKASNNGSLLAGYYLLSFIFGYNTLIVAWILANTDGETKKSFTMSLYNAAASAGNVVGPLLFNSSDAPEYKPGVKATLGVYIGIFCSVILQLVNLVILNRSQERWRVRNGKPAKIHDHSMEETYEDINAGNDYHIGESAFDDLTNRKNNEFVYVY